ncbi:MAG: DUF4019 domain-containing protein [Desulfuromonadales bacterium]|nr:DUF4019 domain-containing protein [Desulfuromonadales bacterium]
MKTRLGIFLALLLILLLPCPSWATGDEQQQVAVAARHFVTLLDAGDAELAWRQLTPLAQILKHQEQWLLLHKTLRKAYGPLDKRDLRGVTLQHRYAMLPDGRYANVQFDTVFSNKRTAVETIILTLSEDGRWLVHDYVIN